MDKSTLLSKLRFIIEKEIGLELYFLYRQKNDDPIQILRANLEGSKTQEKLESVFKSKIKSQLFQQDRNNFV